MEYNYNSAYFQWLTMNEHEDDDLPEVETGREDDETRVIWLNSGQTSMHSVDTGERRRRG